MCRRFVGCLFAALASSACDSADVSTCSDPGSRLHVVHGETYCVYSTGGAPAEGDCPSRVPVRVVRRGVTVCTSDPAPSEEAFDELCALSDGACRVEPLGWTLMPGTRMSRICPDQPELHATSGCDAVVTAWGGGIADTTRDRLLVWGGGGSNYWGNEVYALDVRARSVELVTVPSPPITDPDDCTLTLADGRPNARQTLDNLAYVGHADRMFARAGFVACASGGGGTDTWTLDLATREWQRRDPTLGDPPSGLIAATDYDAETRLVYVHDTTDLWSYDYDSNRYERLTSDMQTDYHLVGRVDPATRLFVMVGGGEAWSFDLASGADYTRTALELAGCDAIVNAPYPGLAYDPIERKLVAWAGGDTVYLIDAEADTCEPRVVAGDPGPQQENGTHGRFRYFASLDAFVLINAMDRDAYVLRLRASP